MILLVVDELEMRCPMSGLGTNVKDDLLLLRVSQACQSTLHLKLEVKTLVGQFLMTKVTAGQQILQPNLRTRRLVNLDFPLEILRGNNKKRLILRLRLV